MTLWAVAAARVSSVVKLLVKLTAAALTALPAALAVTAMAKAWGIGFVSQLSCLETALQTQQEQQQSGWECLQSSSRRATLQED
jgi:hypothetical protein